jgi:hypothetical protein
MSNINKFVDKDDLYKSYWMRPPSRIGEGFRLRRQPVWQNFEEHNKKGASSIAVICKKSS